MKYPGPAIAFLVVLLMCLAGCTGRMPSESSYHFSKAKEDSLHVGKYLFVSKSGHVDSFLLKQFSTPSVLACDSQQLEYGRTHIVPVAAHRLLLDSSFSLSNPGSEPLDLLDSMSRGQDRASRMFYFWVVSKSLKYSDGYYSEGISSTAYSMLDTLPCEFLGYFANTDCMTPSEFDQWSELLGFEFFLEPADIEGGKFARVQKWMRDKCKTCPRAERGIAERMLTIIKKDSEARNNDN